MNILYGDNALWCWNHQGCPARKRVPAALRQRWDTRMPLWGWCTGWTPACRPLSLPAPRRPPRCQEPTDRPKPGSLCGAGRPGRGQGRGSLLSSKPPGGAFRRAKRRPACGLSTAGLAVQGQPLRPGVPGQPPTARACGKPCWNTALSGRRRMPALLRSPCTGRTHQIRVQFIPGEASPVGDGKYGSRVKGAIALQSCGLQFVRTPAGS